MKVENVIINRETQSIREKATPTVINQFELLYAKLKEVSAEDKKRIGISGGVQITEQLSGKLANRTHMCQGFIICTINNQLIDTVKDFSKAVAGKSGVMLGGIYPDGRIDRYYIALE